ncbi:doubled CXXCH domain-containing protein [Malonomonas rubra DSM 5091]|uniref:Doubled CXXCH domain-containing protein n=1 Tax=Malonomonas rubra DSM 5091 TaxID=1122189 RepID=A0A1M6FD13_MALRU|nr:multiheme c-type cytochrome [Malonomonas rubra]SHI95561.1 doubled CXXCH domain-containing protein [Malonomonas rubra DSM 5091]
MKNYSLTVLIAAIVLLTCGASMANDTCLDCHSETSPGLVQDWQISKHAAMGIGCTNCHGEAHSTADDYKKATLPDEKVCAQCHQEQFTSFSHGKHNYGWTSLNAIPATHFAPDELIEGGRGCGGCHNMGIKTDEQKADQLAKGYRYQNNSCDECHTRHAFSLKEAQNPKACQQCHMGYDHPQWEMWSSSKHGTRYFIQKEGGLPDGAAAPTCQTCHLPDGTHENRTAWGFLGVRLPLPEDQQQAADRVTILKALGVLDPETGKPTAIFEAVKAVDMVRLDQASWQKERDKILKICSQCHSTAYAKEQLDMGDAILGKADRLMAEAINTVAALYREGIIKKPAGYPFNYPFLLSFMHTNGAAWNENLDELSYIDQVLVRMYMKHRMRAYQAFFHVNPDYAYWYGWNMMTEDLGEIKALAKTLRAEQQK